MKNLIIVLAILAVSVAEDDSEPEEVEKENDD